MFQGMEYAYAVYKAGSISKAAENLHIAQPSLSANIKRIENKIGYPLFDRSTKPIGLTEAGEQYIRKVEQISALENEFASYINDLGGLKTGKLAFGGSSLFSSWILPSMLASFSAKYPDLDIALIEAKSSELIRMLQESQIDFLLDNKELDTSVFNCHRIAKEELILVVPSKFSVNSELEKYQIPIESIRSGEFYHNDIKPVPLDKLSDYPFITLHNANDTGKRTELIFQENSISPEIVLELDQQLTAYNVASSGVGCTIVGELLLDSVPVNHNLKYYKLDSDHTSRNIYFYWKRGRYLSQAMKVFLESVVEKTELITASTDYE